MFPITAVIGKTFPLPVHLARLDTSFLLSSYPRTALISQPQPGGRRIIPCAPPRHQTHSSSPTTPRLSGNQPFAERIQRVRRRRSGVSFMTSRLYGFRRLRCPSDLRPNRRAGIRRSTGEKVVPGTGVLAARLANTSGARMASLVISGVDIFIQRCFRAAASGTEGGRLKVIQDLRTEITHR